MEAFRAVGRVLPKSIAGQLIALLLTALVLGQIATIVFFVENRRSAVESVAREQILGRTAALVRLIEETPPDIHGRILEAASTSRTVYSIDPVPVVESGTRWPGEDFAVDTMTEMLGPGRDVRAEVRASPKMMDRPPSERMMERPRRDDPPGDRPRQSVGREGDGPAARSEDSIRRFRAFGIGLSVRLDNGQWLNLATNLPSPALFAWPTVASTLMIAAALVVVVIVSVRRITRPLRRLADASDRFGRGETVPDLAEEGPVEIARTIHAFNAMQSRVGRFIADRTRMIAAISHDLRTPLTSLRLRAEFVDDDEIRDKIVATVEEMSRMTEATLAFAREDATAEEARATDLAALVRAVADDFSDIGEDVTVDAPDRLDHVVRQVSLRRALRNLVENALRYGTRARVALTETADAVAIAVEDDGPGIPADRLEEVFEPFVRLETSRSQETGGVGLGLSTARTIVRAHGGDLTLVNRPAGGLIATIHLPRGRR